MNKPLHFCCVNPDDNYYVWQVITFLESAKKLGYSDKCHILIFKPNDRKFWNDEWLKVEKLYPETKIFRYEDKHNITRLIPFYPPIIRPYCLMRHFRDYPELNKSTIFYHDCDIVFTAPFDFSLLSGEKCYLSDAKTYTNADYFKSKINDVLPDKLSTYPDVLDQCAKIVGITKEIIEENNDNSGGAQYILNGVDEKFWMDMIDDCISINNHLAHINREYFESEDKGFQRWCTDMFVLMWGLYRRDITTEIHPELNFAWSTDDINRLKEVKILHNAGVTSDSKIRTRHNKQEVECPAFYKGKYHKSGSPFSDNAYVNNILINEISKKFCMHYYLQKVIEVRDKYNLK